MNVLTASQLSLVSGGWMQDFTLFGNKISVFYEYGTFGIHAESTKSEDPNRNPILDFSINSTGTDFAWWSGRAFPVLRLSFNWSNLIRN